MVLFVLGWDTVLLLVLFGLCGTVVGIWPVGFSFLVSASGSFPVSGCYFTGLCDCLLLI